MRLLNSGRYLGGISRHTFAAETWSGATGFSRKRQWILAGGGILTGSALFAGSMIYLDEDVDRRRGKNGQTSTDNFGVNTKEYLSSSMGLNLDALKIRRVDIASHNSNQPSEDATHIGEFEFSPTLRYASFGVYDGHIGGETANYLSKNLPTAIAGTLADHIQQQVDHDSEKGGPQGTNIQGRPPGSSPDPVIPNETIDEAIKEAFVNVDKYLVQEAAQLVLGLSDETYTALQRGDTTDASPSADNHLRRSLSRTEAIQTLQCAYSGSCALVTLYNPATRLLKVAQTGDCRAILGRRAINTQQSNNDETNHSNVWETHVLSTEQGATSPSEAARVDAQHPNEPDLLRNGRYLGWALTRAFGDGSMKWPIPVQKRLKEEFMGKTPKPICKTPPYFTAEPEITTFQVQKGDFMIIASDGLWDCLTNEEVVGLTGLWVDFQNQNHSPGSGFEKALHVEDGIKPASLEPKQLPVKFGENYQDKTTMYSSYWRAEKRFTNVDRDNVGKHLIRNALGGADEDLRGALLAMKPPKCRDFRDDISVIVVFFD